MHYEDFAKELKDLNESVEWIHFDVMDGHFVPNLTFGPDILAAFRRNSDRFLDVHLMVSDPDYFADVFAKAVADSFVFHYEAYNDIDIIASGGISSMEDLLRLKKDGLKGAIIGKALYTGAIDLREAIRAGEEEHDN